MSCDDVTPDEVEDARTQGEAAAATTRESAPDQPLLRVAWALGFGKVDQLRDAVAFARDNGATWKQIATVTGEHWRTARTKYGGGYEAQARYRARKRGEQQPDTGDT